MAFEQFLQPGEMVQYQYPDKVEIGSDKYELYVTDKRLLMYKSSGFWIFRRDTIIANRISDIADIGFSETGLFSKKGVVSVDTGRKSLTFTGRAEPMRQLYQELQQYTSE